MSQDSRIRIPSTATIKLKLACYDKRKPPYLLSDSLPQISYEVYPFAQGFEISLDNIMHDRFNESTSMVSVIRSSELEDCLSQEAIHQLCKELKCHRKEILVKLVYRCKSVFLLIGNIGLYTRHESIGVFYFIAKDKKLLSGLIDPSFSLQDGDGYTNALISFSTKEKETHFLIENVGDVSSIVIIKLGATSCNFNQTGLKKIKPKLGSTELLAALLLHLLLLHSSKSGRHAIQQQKEASS